MTLVEDRFTGLSQCEEKRLTSQSPQRNGMIRTGVGPGQGDFGVEVK